MTTISKFIDPPFFTARNSIDQVFKSNKTIMGITALFVDEDIDTVSIIMQKIIPRIRFDELGYHLILDIQIIMLKMNMKWINFKNSFQFNDTNRRSYLLIYCSYVDLFGEIDL